MVDPAEDRRFERLRPQADPARGVFSVAPDGMCLSAFLLVAPADGARGVLLGKIDPSQPWSRIGGLDAARLRDLAGRWMLPSSHLLEYEEPGAAAHRIAVEQLEIPELSLRGPDVRSEAYQREAAPSGALHWDLHFLFRAQWPKGRLLRARPFAELRFFDPEALPAEGIARGGADILALAGLGPKRG
jgi:hypothetical protein